MESIRTEKDQEILQRIKDAIVEEPPKKKHNRKWLWAIPSSALACAVAAILIVELVPSPNNDLGDTKYEESNLRQVNSDISELSNALTGLTLNLTEDQTVDIIKYFDLVSGDELYYELTIDESSMLYSMRLVIVVNDKYDYNELKIDEEYATATYSDYSIIYKQQIAVDPDIGLSVIEGSAKVDNAKYEIYILSYKEYSLENGMFLTVINNMLEFN